MSGYTYDPAHSQEPPPQTQPAPTGPLLNQAPQPASIDAYKPKSNTIWYIVVGLVLVIAVVGAIFINNMQGPADTPTSAPPVPTPSETRTGGVPFEDSEVSGYWKITKTQWSTDSVTVTLEIQVDQGRLFYQFYAFGNTDRSQLDPAYEKATDLSPGFATTGEVVTGTVTFHAARQPLTLVLAGTGTNQLSALPIQS